jgi:hypothetical protein
LQIRATHGCRATARKGPHCSTSNPYEQTCICTSMECTPFPATSWIFSHATARSRSSRTSTRQVACGTCGTSASHAWSPVVLPARISGLQAIPALSKRYPAQSLPKYILRAFAQFLPTFLMPCSRRGKPRHVSLNASLSDRGMGSLWTQTMKHNNRELAHRAKKLDGTRLRLLPFVHALDMLNTARARVPCQRQTRP